jgi:subfamily B ATP-binding cassette protein MsbA
VNLEVVRTLLRLWRPFRWALPLIAVLGVTASFAEGLGIGLLIPLLDVLLGGSVRQKGPAVFQAAGEYLASLGNLDGVLLIGAGILVLVVIKAALVFATVSLSASINGQIGHDIRSKLFQQALLVDYTVLNKSRRGQLINIFDAQIDRVMEAEGALIAMFIHTCRIGVFGAMMLLISWQLSAIVVVLGLLANLLIARPLIRSMHRLGEREVDARSAISQQVLRVLGGMRTVRAFGQENQEQACFEKVSQQARAIIVRARQSEQIIPLVLEVVYAPIFVITVLAALLTETGVPTLLAFLVLLYRIQPDIRNLDCYRTQLAGWSSFVDEVAALLARNDLSMRKPGDFSFERLRRGIVFKKVGFQYQSASERPATLSSVTFELRARQITAVVGESGAGKTTLINLLYGFYQPTEGQILVDGRPLVSLCLDMWRGKLALAGQDVGLLDGTIRENIGYGCVHARSSDIEEAARLAAIHDFIVTLPRGYETNVGEGGFRLSRGQQQRIGLARALLRRPEILILDEATNALDGLTEQVIHQTLERLAGKMTVIVIALPTTSWCSATAQFPKWEAWTSCQQAWANSLVCTGARW